MYIYVYIYIYIYIYMYVCMHVYVYIDSRVEPNVFEVVVLAARTDALLRVGRAHELRQRRRGLHLYPGLGLGLRVRVS